MPKLHEILAAEKIPTAAWKTMVQETLKKFKAPDSFFHGHSKSLTMLDQEDPKSKVIEAQNRSEKPVTTTVAETLEYAFDLFARNEDTQLLKNLGNAEARGTIYLHGAVLAADVPVDSLLGIESRLQEVKQLLLAMPTLDATKHWDRADHIGEYVWEIKYPEESAKTAKTAKAVTLSPATKEHPANVQLVHEDVPVGKFTTIARSGECTAAEKAEAIKNIDLIITEVKRARVRTNEIEVKVATIGDKLVKAILEPLRRVNL